MIATARKTATGFFIELPAEAAQTLGLVDGSRVIVAASSEAPEDVTNTARYASTEEALAAFERSLSRHDATYRALAKS